MGGTWSMRSFFPIIHSSRDTISAKFLENPRINEVLEGKLLIHFPYLLWFDILRVIYCDSFSFFITAYPLEITNYRTYGLEFNENKLA